MMSLSPRTHSTGGLAGASARAERLPWLGAMVLQTPLSPAATKGHWETCRVSPGYISSPTLVLSISVMKRSSHSPSMRKGGLKYTLLRVVRKNSRSPDSRDCTS